MKKLGVCLLTCALLMMQIFLPSKIQAETSLPVNTNIVLDDTGDNYIVVGENEVALEYAPQRETNEAIIPESITYENVTYTVTEIGSYFFNSFIGKFMPVIDGGPMDPDRPVITKMVLPNTVTRIRDSAFENSAITEIVIPNSVTSIGSHAFDGCVALTDIKLPSSIESIGSYAFAYSEKLTQVDLSETKITRLEEGAFTFCKELRKVTLPDTLTYIGNGAFEEAGFSYILNHDPTANVFKEITIPDSVSEIGERAFQYTGLTSITLPKQLKELKTDTFYGCYDLESVIFPSGLETIAYGSVFSKTKIKRLDLPEGLKSIGERAFFDMRELQTVTLPESLESIGKNAFSRLYDGASLTITYHGTGENLTVDTDAFRFSNSNYSASTLTIQVDQSKYTGNAFESSTYDGTTPITTTKVNLNKQIIYQLDNKDYLTVKDAGEASQVPDIVSQGWYTLGEKSTDEQGNTIIPLIAKEFNATYDLNGGELPVGVTNPAKFNYKSTDSERTLANPTRKGFDFAGWYADGVKVTKVPKLAKDCELVAKWERTKNNLTVNLVDDENNPLGNGSHTSKDVIIHMTFENALPSDAKVICILDLYGVDIDKLTEATRIDDKNFELKLHDESNYRVTFKIVYGENDELKFIPITFFTLDRTAPKMIWENEPITENYFGTIFQNAKDKLNNINLITIDGKAMTHDELCDSPYKIYGPVDTDTVHTITVNDIAGNTTKMNFTLKAFPKVNSISIDDIDEINGIEQELNEKIDTGFFAGTDIDISELQTKVQKLKMRYEYLTVLAEIENIVSKVSEVDESNVNSNTITLLSTPLDALNKMLEQYQNMSSLSNDEKAIVNKLETEINQFNTLIQYYDIVKKEYDGNIALANSLNNMSIVVGNADTVAKSITTIQTYLDDYQKNLTSDEITPLHTMSINVNKRLTALLEAQKALADELQSVQKMKLKYYTETSRKALQDALSLAKQAMNDTTSNTDVLNANTKAVTEAVKQLIKITDTPILDIKGIKTNINQTSLDTISDTLIAMIEKINRDETVNNIDEKTLDKVKELIKTGKTINTKVEVKKLDETTIDPAIINRLTTAADQKKDIKIGQYLDLSILLVADGNPFGTITKLDQAITVQIQIPDAIRKDGRTYYILRDHDGKIDLIETKSYQDGTLEFETDVFSTYAIAYTDKDITSVQTKDTSNTNGYIALMISGMGLMGMVLISMKKRNLYKN